MSLAVNNASGGASSDSPISYNAGTGSGRILIVAVGIAWESTNTITGVTYSASAMTKLGDNDDPNNWGRVEYYYHLSPAEGANNIAITSDDNSVSAYMACYISGADTSSISAPSYSQGDGTAQSVSITPAASGNLLLATFIHGTGTDTYAAGAGTTLEGQAGNWIRVALASKATTGTGSHTLNLTASDIDGWAAIVAEITVASATTSVKDLIGGIIPFPR